MKLAQVVAVAASCVLAAGCGGTVPGSAAGTTAPDPTTTAATPTPSATPTSTGPTTTPDEAETPPLTVDESRPAQYCEDTFTGALGKPMHAVVVETPSGFLGCDEAAAILFDYYAERPDPEFGRSPLQIGPLACNQAEEGQFPQVICADPDNLIYSMWPQT